MHFEFATAARIVFGAGSLKDIGPATRGFGRHALVVTGRDATRAEPLLDLFRQEGIAATVFPIPHEPSTHRVEEGVRLAREAGCDFVAGFACGIPTYTRQSLP